MRQINKEEILESELTHLIETWGQTALTLVGFIWGFAAFKTEMKVLARDFKNHTETYDEDCRTQKSEIEKLENKLGLRISGVEINHDKLQELIYREMKSLSNEVSAVNNRMQDVHSSVKETEGYLRAQREFNESTRNR